VYKDYSRNYTWFAKRQASKAVRRYKGEIPNGSSYRKVYNSWDIFDWRIFYTKFEIGVGAGDGSYVWLTEEEYKKMLRK